MNSKFILLLSSVFLTIIFLIFILVYVPFLSGFFVYDFIQIMLIVSLIAISLWTLHTILTISLLCYNKKVPSFMKKNTRAYLFLLFPAIEWMSDLWKINKDFIRQTYMKLNNELVLSDEIKLYPKDVLLITPHCLQKSACEYKITNDVNNCRRCGKCKVNSLIELKEKYGVKFQIVSGGTVARLSIKDVKPKAIIAIACERDLVSGLNDVRKIPLIAIINDRLNGPCVDTSVDIEEVEKAIINLLKE